MEELTEKEEAGELYDIILKNCYSCHPSEPLPSNPFFLETQNISSKILKEILAESSYDHKKFSRKIAKTIIYYKSQKEMFDVRRASLLRESLDILEVIQNIGESNYPATHLVAKIQKSQSTKGPITVSLQVGFEEHLLEEGDNVEFPGIKHDFLNAKFILDDGESQYSIGEATISFKSMVEGFHYLKAMEKSELDTTIHKKGADFEVIVLLKLRLSKSDRLDIIREKQIENEHELNDEKKDPLIYESILTSLNVKETNPGFKSNMKTKRHREYCCESCSIH